MNDEIKVTINKENIMMDTKEITVPEQKETFEAQVVVISQPYKKMVSPSMISGIYVDPLGITHRILDSKHYHAELIMPGFVNGKPTLIIYEDKVEDE